MIVLLLMACIAAMPQLPSVRVMPGEQYPTAVCRTYRGLVVATANFDPQGEAAELVWCADKTPDGRPHPWPYSIGLSAGATIQTNVSGLEDPLTIGVAGNLRMVCPYTCGDINGDGVQNGYDFALFAVCFGRQRHEVTGGCSTPEDYACSDMTGNGTIDLFDFGVYASCQASRRGQDG